MLNFLEKNIKWINIILSIVTICVIFAIMKPVFWVQANNIEDELLHVEVVEEQKNTVQPITPQDIELIKFIKNINNISLMNKYLQDIPNIVVTNKHFVVDPIIVTVVTESDSWYTVIWNNKLFYVSKMALSSSDKANDTENVTEEINVNTETTSSNTDETSPNNETPTVSDNNSEIKQEAKPEPEQTPEYTPESEPESESKSESEPEYTVETIDKTQYVTTNSLNVRIGPGTNYEKIGSLELNNSVHVIGIVNNGWSQIEYDGKIAFVSSSYLSDNKVEISSGNKIENYPNAYGILKIADVGVDVVLYDRPVYEYSQDIVDRTNSAAYLWADEYYGMDLIADHKHQGFSAIANSVPGQTIAKIITPNGTKTFICVDKFVGINQGYDMVDTSGVSITGRNNGGICMYTCYPAHPDIIITFWQPC